MQKYEPFNFKQSEALTFCGRLWPLWELNFVVKLWVFFTSESWFLVLRIVCVHYVCHFNMNFFACLWALCGFFAFFACAVLLMNLFVSEIVLFSYDLVNLCNHPSDESDNTRHDKEGETDSDDVQKAYIWATWKVVSCSSLLDRVEVLSAQLRCHFGLFFYLSLHLVNCSLLFCLLFFCEKLLLARGHFVIYGWTWSWLWLNM